MPNILIPPGPNIRRFCCRIIAPTASPVIKLAIITTKLSQVLKARYDIRRNRMLDRPTADKYSREAKAVPSVSNSFLNVISIDKMYETATETI